MNLKLNKTFILGILIICIACFQQIQGQQKNIKLSQVRTIFVEPIEVPQRIIDFSNVLKDELRRMNFIIAEDKETADAILTLKDLQVEITLHGTRDDVDKWLYEFELTSQTGEIIWKKPAKFLTTDNKEENNKIASQKIAEKLFYDRLKAQKKDKSPN